MPPEGCFGIIGVAAILGVFKAVTYFVLFWACSTPSISSNGGRRLERAFWASFARTYLGVFTTPLFVYWVRSIDGPSPGWLFFLVHLLVRFGFWVGVALVVYRKAPFHSKGHRLYFTVSVAAFGMALNLGWDHVLSLDAFPRSEQRWGC